MLNSIKKKAQDCINIFYNKCKDITDIVKSRISSLSFEKSWRYVFLSDAKTYNGLYNGLRRITEGKAQKPEKIIKEWCIRTENKFGECHVTDICRKRILLAAENTDNEKCSYYAKKLLKAATSAGIYREAEKEITITERNINAYIEWDGKEIYEDDKAEIINPAWYQNNVVIEQGHCKIIGE